MTSIQSEIAAIRAADLPQGLKALLTQSQIDRMVSMTHARLADIEAAIARDESTNPDAYYEYQGTIDESHQRHQLAHDVLTTLQRPFSDDDRAFLAPDGKWTTIRSDHDATLPTGGPTVDYGAAGI